MGEAALRWLGDMQKNKRPRKRKGLVAHLHTHFARGSLKGKSGIVDRMIASGKLSEAAGAITYHL